MNASLLDLIILVYFVIYGYKYLASPPDFGSDQGLGVKRARKSPEAWRFAHRFGGIYCISSGVIIGIFAAIKHYVYHDTVPMPFTVASYLVKLVLVLCILPAVSLALKLKFRDK